MRATVHLGIIDSLEAFAECHKTKLSLADVATEAPVMVELAGAGFEALHGINFFAAAAASHTRTRVSILAGRHRQDDFLGIRFCGIVDGVGVVVRWTTRSSSSKVTSGDPVTGSPAEKLSDRIHWCGRMIASERRWVLDGPSRGGQFPEPAFLRSESRRRSDASSRVTPCDDPSWWTSCWTNLAEVDMRRAPLAASALCWKRRLLPSPSSSYAGLPGSRLTWPTLGASPRTSRHSLGSTCPSSSKRIFQFLKLVETGTLFRKFWDGKISINIFARTTEVFVFVMKVYKCSQVGIWLLQR